MIKPYPPYSTNRYISRLALNDFPVPKSPKSVMAGDKFVRHASSGAKNTGFSSPPVVPIKPPLRSPSSRVTPTIELAKVIGVSGSTKSFIIFLTDGMNDIYSLN